MFHRIVPLHLRCIGAVDKVHFRVYFLKEKVCFGFLIVVRKVASAQHLFDSFPRKVVLRKVVFTRFCWAVLFDDCQLHCLATSLSTLDWLLK